MDSLTQIALGAACGEVVAGKKLGNRALLWGAVGGTIPDLDVLGGLFMDEIAATSFHRGFMHSFLFAALAPWVLAKLTMWFYGRNVHRRRGFKLGAMLVWVIFYLGAATAINFIPVMLGEGLKWYVLAPTLALGGWFVWKLWHDYWSRDLEMVEVPYRTWVALFFWAIFTHPILDCCTGWGTQIWQPFSDLRVQWNLVSVVDWRATVPFGICLVVVSWIARTNVQRSRWNWLGLAWFCGYIFAYTGWHKWQAGQVFEKTLQEKNIDYQRFMVGPTIFNNIVWNCLAEGDTAYYHGLLGFNDCRQEIFLLNVIPKNRHLASGIRDDDRAMKFLKWFSDGYYNTVQRPDGKLQFNDLRFGTLGDSLKGAQSYVFPFIVDEIRDGHMAIRHERNVEESKKRFPELFKRMRGICPE